MSKTFLGGGCRPYSQINMQLFLGARAPLPIARDCHSVSQSLSLSSKSFKNIID